MKIFAIFIFAFVLFNLLEQHSTKYLLVEVEGDAPEEPPIVEDIKCCSGPIPLCKEPCKCCSDGKWHSGQRGLGSCDKIGLHNSKPCMKSPESDCERGCNFLWEPVCGSDAKTHSNKCMFGIAKCKNPSLTVKHEGRCKELNEEELTPRVLCATAADCGRGPCCDGVCKPSCSRMAPLCETAADCGRGACCNGQCKPSCSRMAPLCDTAADCGRGECCNGQCKPSCSRMRILCDTAADCGRGACCGGRCADVDAGGRCRTT